MTGIDEFLKFQKELTALVKECGIDKYLKMRDDRVAFLVCQYLQNLRGIMHDRDEWNMFLSRMGEPKPAEKNAHEVISKKPDEANIPHEGASGFTPPPKLPGDPKGSTSGFVMENNPQVQDERFLRGEDELDHKLLEMEKRYDELWDIVESLLTEKSASAKDFSEPAPDKDNVPVINFPEPASDKDNVPIVNFPQQASDEDNEDHVPIINFFDPVSGQDHVPVINFPEPVSDEDNEDHVPIINFFDQVHDEDHVPVISFPEPASDEDNEDHVPIINFFDSAPDEDNIPIISFPEPTLEVVPTPKPEPARGFELETKPYNTSNTSNTSNLQDNCVRIGQREAGFHISCFKCVKQQECQNSHDNQRVRR